jgi:hypothetical protein
MRGIRSVYLAERHLSRPRWIGTIGSLNPEDMWAEDDPAEFEKVGMPPDRFTTARSQVLSVIRYTVVGNWSTYLNLSHDRDFIQGELNDPSQHMIHTLTVRMLSEKNESSLPSGGVKPGSLKLFRSPMTYIVHEVSTSPILSLISIYSLERQWEKLRLNLRCGTAADSFRP